MKNLNEIKSNKYLFKITIPVFIETLFSMLVGQVDQIMVSSKTENGFAAIGNANQVINMLLLFFQVVAMASTIMISQYIGANEKSKLNRIYALSIYFNIFLSVIMSSVLFINGKAIYTALNCPQELLADCLTYTKIIAFGFIFDALRGTYAAFYKSNGYMKECMYITVIVNIINICGNTLFLYGFFGLPQLGVKGVAYASIISKFIGFVLVYCLKRRFNISTSIRHIIPFPFKILLKVLSIGFPAMGENFAYGVAMIFIQKFVNSFGVIAVEARIAVTTVSFVSWIFCVAIAITTQIIIGYLMGAKEYDSVKQRYVSSIKIAMALTFVGSIILYITGSTLCSLFISSPESLELCQKILLIDILLEQGRAVNLVSVRTLQACGDNKFPIVAATIDIWVVAVFGAYLLGVVFNLGLIGIWIALAADELLRGIMYIIRFRTGKWKTFNVIAEN